MTHVCSKGGFRFPIIYQKSQRHIEKCLSQANIDYASLTQWTLPDDFLCFLLETDFLQFVDNTYPNPRQKNEVPIWFLITCQFLMRLHQTGKYRNLRYLLHAGSLLTRFGYNVGSDHIGFNDKNKKNRKTAIHDDTVRKFFKDTDPKEINAWYQINLQHWFKTRKIFHHTGIFILDQSHLVVPDNKNYKHAVKMPVDEHGQLYPHVGSLTPEQKSELVYHPCYALSVLLHVTPAVEQYHIASYELGAGDTDELVHAEAIIPKFCREFPGTMKELIMDRGYIDGDFINKIKQDHQVDVLIPLKTNMNIYQDAIAIAEHDNLWERVPCDKNKKEIKSVDVAWIDNMELWDNAKMKQTVILCKETLSDSEKEQGDTRYFVLATTKSYKTPLDAINRYRLRMRVEERFRQFKRGWNIGEFPSPHESLIESHVCFILLTYSLLQLYMQRHDLQKQAQKMITSFKAEEQLGTDAVVVYSDQYYGVFDLDEYTSRVANMADDPRQQLIKLMEAQKRDRLKRTT